MRFFKHISKHDYPDPANYVQMVGYHSLEDAYHRLLERGEINIPRHMYNSHDFDTNDPVDPNILDSDQFRYGDDKYEASSKARNMDLNPAPAPKLDPVKDPPSDPLPAPSQEPPKE